MTRISNVTVATLAASALALSACSREPAADNVVIANDMGAEADMAAANDMMTGNAAAAMQSASLIGADRSPMGNVAASEGPGGVTIAVSATGLPAGTHGIHLHEKGLCEGPKFTSAGAHWNPGMKEHGRDNPQGAHLGDLANLEVGADGSGSANFTVAGAMMTSGAPMLADADGTALVIHAKPDDYKTDPSGDSGDRIACAVIAPAPARAP